LISRSAKTTSRCCGSRCPPDVRVLVVDDHPIARQGLANLARDTFLVERVDEAGNARDALVAAKVDAPALILLDLHIPGVPQTSVLCTQLRGAAPAAKIVLVTAFEEADAIKRCFAAGVEACLLKDTSLVDLRQALKAVLAGRRVIDPRIAQTLATERVRALRGETLSVDLTQREREVLELLAEGCSNRLIAERLFLAETTVKGYVSSLLDKFQATSRLQAVVRAMEQGLL
jgi:DNA-binding NarL/FixJ family response regulator